MPFLTYCNCYNDKIRSKAMIILYIIDLIFSIVRLSLVANDMSFRIPATMPFLVPILVFDMAASVPLTVCNIIYMIMRFCIDPLVGDELRHRSVWRFATLTCIRFTYHRERPQIILLTRLLFILCFTVLRFICFVIGASCSARFQTQCTAYTVIAALALVNLIISIVIELVHFSRLWSYNPTKPRGNQNRVGDVNDELIVERTHRRHLRFIHHSLLNDQNADGFRRSRCPNGPTCRSRALHHHLFYHSLDSERDIEAEFADEALKKSFVAFHRTDKESAYRIARKGFPFGDHTGKNKDYLHMDKKIFFTPHAMDGPTQPGATICASLNLDRVECIDSDINLDLNAYFARGDGACDTVYVKSTKRLYLRMPAQVQRWIIAIDRDVAVNDALDGAWYRPCI